MSNPNPPLNYEPSHLPTNAQSSPTLPPEVTQCLRSARFLHLATIAYPTDPSDPLPTPHVSLMNYTFLPNYSPPSTSSTTVDPQGEPVILMTTNTQSLKTQNLRHNPRVSLLVHDWSSHRPPTAAPRSASPTSTRGASSLASLLLNLNTSALSSISTTISGEARFIPSGTEEERWCKEAHLANNTFEGQLSTEAGYFGTAQTPTDSQRDIDGDGKDGVSGYIEGSDVQVVLVPVRRGRISDFKGGVRDWKVVREEDETEGQPGIGRRGEELVNGVV